MGLLGAWRPLAGACSQDRGPSHVSVITCGGGLTTWLGGGVQSFSATVATEMKAMKLAAGGVTILDVWTCMPPPCTALFKLGDKLTAVVAKNILHDMRRKTTTGHRGLGHCILDLSLLLLFSLGSCACEALGLDTWWAVVSGLSGHEGW